MMSFWVNSVVCCAVLGMFAGLAEAGPLDVYKQMVANKMFTFKYECVTPAARIKNRDKLRIYNRSGLETDGIKFLTNRNSSGLVVMSGDFKQEEVTNDTSAVGKITTGGKVYNFVRGLEKGKMSYFGSGAKGAVKAEDINLLDAAYYGESYGDRTLTKIFQIMLPESQRPINAPKFVFYGSGHLSNGMYYEDYVCRSEKEAVRYYFQNNKMLKIATANYYQGADGTTKGSRNIYKVLEFSPKVDKDSLKLPSEMKVEKQKVAKEGEDE